MKSTESICWNCGKKTLFKITWKIDGSGLDFECSKCGMKYMKIGSLPVSFFEMRDSFR